MTDTSYESDFDAAAAFAALDKPQEDPRKPEEAPESHTEDSPAPAPEDHAEQESSSKDASPEASHDDDPEVELPFGEESRKFKLSELRKTIDEYSQFRPRFEEATKAAQSHSEATQRYTEAYSEMYRRAQERYKPYENIDWMVLSRDPNIDGETFAQIRADAQAAHNDLAFLSQEIDGRLKEVRASSEAATRERARAAWKELSDPEKGIKGFGPELYQTLLKFGNSSGVEGVEHIVEPHLIRLLHKAYLYDQGQTQATSKVEKVVNKPSRVIRPGSSQSAESSSRANRAEVFKALKANPNDPAAIAAAFGA